MRGAGMIAFIRKLLGRCAHEWSIYDEGQYTAKYCSGDTKSSRYYDLRCTKCGVMRRMYM